MITAALTLALLASPQDHWQTYRVGKSGLRLSLPAEPRTNISADQTEIKIDFKSVKVTITANPLPINRPQLSQLYTEKFNRFREQYGRKITGILNEQPVIEADMYGAKESIGFVIEVDAEGGIAHAWQKVRFADFEYDIAIDCSRRDQPVMEKILASAQYIDPETNDFQISPLGGTGLQGYLGIAFLAQAEVAREESKSVVLSSDQFPAMVLATVWTSDEIDYENEAQLKTHMTKWLASFVQGAQSNLTLKSEKQVNQTVYEISGEVVVQGTSITLLGKAFARRDDAQAVIAVVDPQKEGGQEFAKKILATVKQIKPED